MHAAVHEHGIQCLLQSQHARWQQERAKGAVPPLFCLLPAAAAPGSPVCLGQWVATNRLLMLVGLALLPLLLQQRWLLLQASKAVLQHWRDEPRQAAIRALLQLRRQAAEDQDSA